MEKWQWFDKLCINLKNGDSVAWSGSTFHSLHNNTDSGYALYYVLFVHKALPEEEEVFEDENDEEKKELEDLLHTNRLRQQLRHFPDIKFPYYRQGFDWIFQNTHMLHWIENNQTTTISDIHAKIQIETLIDFKCNE